MKQKQQTIRWIVAEARYQLNMTQECFAEVLKVDERSVRRWEAGNSCCSSAILIEIVKLCKERGIDLDITSFFIIGQFCPFAYFTNVYNGH